MLFLLRSVVCGLLLWQAVVAGIDAANRVQAGRAVGWDLRLLADTDTRMQRALGADVEIVHALRSLLPPGSLLLNRAVTGTIEELRQQTSDEQQRIARFQHLAAKNGLFVQLTGLLYPTPFFLSVADPIAAVEHNGDDGPAAASVWLFVLAEDPSPAGRPGWTRVHHEPRFDLWRFQKV